MLRLWFWPISSLQELINELGSLGTLSKEVLKIVPHISYQILKCFREKASKAAEALVKLFHSNGCCSYPEWAAENWYQSNTDAYGWFDIGDTCFHFFVPEAQYFIVYLLANYVYKVRNAMLESNLIFLHILKMAHGQLHSEKYMLLIKHW